MRAGVCARLSALSGPATPCSGTFINDHIQIEGCLLLQHEKSGAIKYSEMYDLRRGEAEGEGPARGAGTEEYVGTYTIIQLPIVTEEQFNKHKDAGASKVSMMMMMRDDDDAWP